MAKGLILIQGEKIGFQFNAKSMGERKVVRTVNVDEKGRSYISYMGMTIEVVATDMQDADNNTVYNAVRQIPVENNKEKTIKKVIDETLHKSVVLNTEGQSERATEKVRIIERNVGNVTIYSAWVEAKEEHNFTNTEMVDGVLYGQLGSENPYMNKGLSLRQCQMTHMDELGKCYQRAYDEITASLPEITNGNVVQKISGFVYVYAN